MGVRVRRGWYRSIAGPTRAAVLALAVLGAVGYAAALPAAYRRAAGLDPAVVEHGSAVHAGLAQWGISTGTFAVVWLAGITAIAMVFVSVGVLVVLRRPDDPAALLFAAVLIGFGVIWPNTVPAPGWPAPATAAGLVLGVLSFIGFFGLPFYFPDGRFVPGWSRWVFALLATHVVVAETLLAFGVRVPAALDLAVLLGWASGGIWAQVHRYRRVSTAGQRQQTKWVAAALVLAVGGFVVVAALGQLSFFSSPSGAVLYIGLQLFAFGLLFCLVPGAVARAMLRHRLWDIDPLLNRTLVYGVLTVALAAVYAGIVTWTGRAVDGPVASFLAAGTVALLFEPLRRRLQVWANQLTYGQHDDPYRALTALARRLQQADEQDDLLPIVARSVRRATRSPYAAITDPAGAVLADSGKPVPDPLAIPLTHQGETLGALLVGPRMPGDRFDPRDRHLLDGLAGQTESALHTVQLRQRAAGLATQLQASRQRLVSAREEERRRLRRELHDSLGPTLAAQAMQVETAHDLLHRRPDEAAALLKEVLSLGADAVAEVRRIARGLRPPALEELGLAGAVRQAAAELSGPVQVRVVAPGRLPILPAAVEVAAYAIVREALTNVVRHSGARGAQVRFDVDSQQLVVEVTDDGRGLPEAPAGGVGSASMRERAHELGGGCSLVPRPEGGTLVSARLPLNQERADGAD
jgi:signal transduction histidine kinase